MKKILPLLVLSFAILAPVYAQEIPEVAAPSAAVTGEKRELILKFIDVFGTKRAMQENLKAMFEDMGENDPQTKNFKDNVRVDEIIEQLIPLYDKHFTADELRACIAFYTSADGQKLLEAIPALMRESVDVSAKYFEDKFPAEKEVPVEEIPAEKEDTTQNTTP